MSLPVCRFGPPRSFISDAKASLNSWIPAMFAGSPA